MLNILVVDDEQREREGIEYLVQKHKLPFKVDKAENGKQAMELFSKSQYDVVMTDIKMPIMDGIELIRRLREISDVIIVIYSAYGEFEYAKTAISNGVSNYILKPLVVEDFLTCFEDLIRKCEQKRKTEQAFESVAQIRTFQFNSDIFYFMNQREESLCESSDRYNRCAQYLAGRKFLPMMINSENETFIRYFELLFQDLSEMTQGNAVNIMINESAVLALLFEVNDSRNITESLINKYERFNTKIGIAVGHPVSTVVELKKEYDKMNDLLEGYFVLNSSYVVSTENQYGVNETTDVPGILIQAIKSSVECKNIDMAEKQIDKLLNYIIINNRNSVIYMKYILSEIMKSILEAAGSSQLFENYLHKIYTAKNKEKIQAILTQALDEMKKDIQESGKGNHRIVKAIKEIIAQEYGNTNLGLTYLADKVNLSPAYLSGLFKSETGNNIVQYITEFRLDKARMLLETTFYRVGEISEMVGYSNHSYFTLLFNNTYGKRPIDYREKKKD